MPGGRERDRRDERGEEDEEQADAVDADVIAGAEPRHPARVFHELIVGGAALEPEVEGQREHERQQRHRERASAKQRLPPARHEEQEDRPRDGQEGDRGEDPDGHLKVRRVFVLIA